MAMHAKVRNNPTSNKLNFRLRERDREGTSSTIYATAKIRKDDVVKLIENFPV